MGLNMVGAPAMDRLDSNLIFWHPIFAVCHITGRCDGDAIFHRLKPANFFELRLEFHASLLQEPEIRLAVG